MAGVSGADHPDAVMTGDLGTSFTYRTPVAGLEERLLALEQQLAQSVDPLRRNQRAIEQRLDAATATNKLLREEVLAVAERAGLLEEAIARQAEQRLRGELLLKLNEAEFLLLMGAERLRLFGDVGTDDLDGEQADDEVSRQGFHAGSRCLE